MGLQRSASWAVAVAAATVSLAVPGTANANHGQPFLDDTLTTYFGVAQAHWGGSVPSCVANGVTTVPVHAVVYDDPDRDVAARADQPGCRLWLDRSSWRSMRPREACMVVVHEWGHLLGHGHVEGAGELMAELPVRLPLGCAALERRELRVRASVRRARPCSAWRKRLRLRLGRVRSPRVACVRRRR